MLFVLYKKSRNIITLLNYFRLIQKYHNFIVFYVSFAFNIFHCLKIYKIILKFLLFSYISVVMTLEQYLYVIC